MIEFEERGSGGELPEWALKTMSRMGGEQLSSLNWLAVMEWDFEIIVIKQIRPVLFFDIFWSNGYKSFDSSSSMSFARLIWHRQQIHYFQVKQKWEILLEAIVSEWWGLCQDGWGEIRGGAAFRGKLRQIFVIVLEMQPSIFHDSVLKFCRMTLHNQIQGKVLNNID